MVRRMQVTQGEEIGMKFILMMTYSHNREWVRGENTEESVFQQLSNMLIRDL